MDSTTPPAYAGFARDMRERFLTRPPAEWGMVPTAENPDVYGVLMEWRADDATVTVAAFCDGSASVYSTRGPGMIGGEADDVVRGEARCLVRCAADFLDDAAPAAEFPYPEPERVQFCLLTFAGVRMMDAELDALYDGVSPLAGLYDHGWAVFERFLEVTRRDGDEAGGCGGYRKEWAGTDGYVSCVLTALARGIGPRSPSPPRSRCRTWRRSRPATTSCRNGWRRRSSRTNRWMQRRWCGPSARRPAS